MSTDTDLQRQVTSVFADAAPSGYPDELLARVLSTTSRSRPRPAWLADIKEPPMRYPARVAVGSPTLRLASVLALTLALILAAAGVVVAGASLLPTQPLPPPFGPARNGPILYAKDGDIYLADASGVAARALITGDTNDWSPWFSHDGTKIAFARSGKLGKYALMIADSDGANQRQILDPSEWNAEFMPNDEEMVVTRLVDGGRRLSMIDVSTGSIRDLELGGLDPDYWQEPRPPAGDEIIFKAKSAPNSSTLGWYAIRPDGSGLRTIGALADQESYGNASKQDRISFQDPALSPLGSTIAYWSWEPRADRPDGPSDAFMHLRDLTTGQELPIRFDPMGTSNPKGDDNGLMVHFSPDGTMVVFEGCSVSTAQLCYGAVDGSTPSRPIGPPYYYGDRKAFAFSPDGQQVMLALTNKTETIDIATDTTETYSDIPNGDAWPSWQRLAP